MGTPQIIYIILSVFELGIGTARHGERKQGYHNFWVDLTAILLQTALLYWGGFFD